MPLPRPASQAVVAALTPHALRKAAPKERRVRVQILGFIDSAPVLLLFMAMTFWALLAIDILMALTPTRPHPCPLDPPPVPRPSHCSSHPHARARGSHLLTYSLTHSSTHSLIHSLTHPLTYLPRTHAHVSH